MLPGPLGLSQVHAPKGVIRAGKGVAARCALLRLLRLLRGTKARLACLVASPRRARLPILLAVLLASIRTGLLLLLLGILLLLWGTILCGRGLEGLLLLLLPGMRWGLLLAKGAVSKGCRGGCWTAVLLLATAVLPRLLLRVLPSLLAPVLLLLLVLLGLGDRGARTLGWAPRAKQLAEGVRRGLRGLLREWGGCGGILSKGVVAARAGAWLLVAAAGPRDVLLLLGALRERM